MTSGSGQQVVVVDGVPETTQVLRAILEPKGHRVERVRGIDGLASRSAPPSVVVLHDDGAPGTHRQHKYGTVPRVVIGSLRSAECAASDGGNERTLSQPFQYAELIRAVEALLMSGEARRPAA